VKVLPFEDFLFLDTHPLEGRILSSGSGSRVPGIRCLVPGVEFLGQDYRRIVMGLLTNRVNENRPRRHLRGIGAPFLIQNTVDSRLRRDDVISRELVSAGVSVQTIVLSSSLTEGSLGNRYTAVPVFGEQSQNVYENKGSVRKSTTLDPSLSKEGNYWAPLLGRGGAEGGATL